MKNKIIIISIFLIALLLHSVPTLESSYPVGVDSYYFLRIGKLMADSGFNLQQDPLSYGGRPFQYPLGLPYTLGILSMFSPLEVSGIILTLVVGALSSVLILLLGMQLFKQENEKKKLAFFAALLYSAVPVVMWKSSVLLNSTYEIFLLLLAIYFMMNLRLRKFFILPCLALLLFSPALSILAILFSLTYLKERKIWIQITILVVITILASAAYFDSFLQLYVGKDIPSEIRSAIYPNLTPVQILYRINPLILIGGVLSFLMMARRIKTIKGVWRLHSDQKIFVLFTSLLVVSFIFGIGEPDRILYYMAIPLSLGTGYFITRWQSKKMIAVFLIFFSVSIILMAAAWGDLGLVTPTKDEYDSLRSLNSTSMDSVILSSEINGHLVSYLSGRKNFMDGNLINSDIKRRFEDAKIIYTTVDTNLRKELMDKNNIIYILFSRWEAERFKTSRMVLDKDPGLAILIDKGDTVIYQK